MDSRDNAALGKLPPILLTLMEAHTTTAFAKGMSDMMAAPLQFIIDTGEKVLDTVRPSLTDPDPEIRRVAGYVYHDGTHTVALARQMLAFKTAMAERAGADVTVEEARVLKESRKIIVDSGQDPDSMEEVRIDPVKNSGGGGGGVDAREALKALVESVVRIAGPPPPGIAEQIEKALNPKNGSEKITGRAFDEGWTNNAAAKKSKPSSDDWQN